MATPCSSIPRANSGTYSMSTHFTLSYRMTPSAKYTSACLWLYRLPAVLVPIIVGNAIILLEVKVTPAGLPLGAH